MFGKKKKIDITQMNGQVNNPGSSSPAPQYRRQTPPSFTSNPSYQQMPSFRPQQTNQVPPSYPNNQYPRNNSQPNYPSGTPASRPEYPNSNGFSNNPYPRQNPSLASNFTSKAPNKDMPSKKDRRANKEKRLTIIKAVCFGLLTALFLYLVIYIILTGVR